MLYGSGYKAGGVYYPNRSYRTGRAFKSKRARRSRRRTGNLRRAIQNQRIGGYLGIERKFFDTQYDQQISIGFQGNSDPTGTMIQGNDTSSISGTKMVPFNAVSQGDGENERDGRVMSWRQLHIQGSIEYVADVISGNGLNLPIVRVVLVLDKQCNGALPEPGAIFDIPGAPSSNRQSVNAFRNLENTQRFTVLADRLINFKDVNGTQWVNAAGNDKSTGQRMQIPFSFHKKFSDIRTNFTGTTSTISAIKDNALYLMAWRTTDGTQEDLHLRLKSRFRFVG